MHKLKKKRYDSLTTVATEIRNAKKERIESFNGFSIITNKNVYGLTDGEVSVMTREEYENVRSAGDKVAAANTRKSRTGEEIISGVKDSGKTRNRPNVSKRKKATRPKGKRASGRVSKVRGSGRNGK